MLFFTNHIFFPTTVHLWTNLNYQGKTWAEWCACTCYTSSLFTKTVWLIVENTAQTNYSFSFCAPHQPITFLLVEISHFLSLSLSSPQPSCNQVLSPALFSSYQFTLPTLSLFRNFNQCLKRDRLLPKGLFTRLISECNFAIS